MLTKKYYFLIALFYIQTQLIASNITIEGMPGGGKTSSLLSLVGELPEELVLLSETNPEPDSQWAVEEVSVQGDIYHQIWLDRMQATSQLVQATETVFLFDRSYFSNLAFKYAWSGLTNTDDYSEYLPLFKRDLSYHTFDLIIVLDVDPEVALERRHHVDEHIPYPWCNKDFLALFQKFYIEELPTLVDSPIVYLKTDAFSQAETKLAIKALLAEYIKPYAYFCKALDSEGAEKAMIKFAQEYNLGTTHSQVVNVFGYPTMYFLQHSLQYVEDKVVFFNNKRLQQLAADYEH